MFAAEQIVKEPGDKTRYVFSVRETKSGWTVWKQNGIPSAHTFTDADLIPLKMYAPEVLRASYEEYQQAVEANPWMPFLFDKAERAKANPWTYLAAMSAALEVAGHR